MQMYLGYLKYSVCTQLKTMKKIAIALFLVVAAATQAAAQDSTKTGIKELLEAKQWAFEPLSMTPSRGRMRTLTAGYTLRLNGDTLMVYLPYVGRAYNAPISSSESGYDFTTTEFTYDVKPAKKKGYAVAIKTNGKVYNSEFAITVYDDGTAYVRAMSTNREVISYNGSIKKKQ